MGCSQSSQIEGQIQSTEIITTDVIITEVKKPFLHLQVKEPGERYKTVIPSKWVSRVYDNKPAIMVFGNVRCTFTSDKLLISLDESIDDEGDIIGQIEMVDVELKSYYPRLRAMLVPSYVVSDQVKLFDGTRAARCITLSMPNRLGYPVGERIQTVATSTKESAGGLYLHLEA